MNRSAVFLDEMKVGPLWRLRQGAAPAGVAEIVAEAPPDVAVIAEAAVAPVVIAPAPAPAPVPPAVVAGDDSTAWFDDAPPPPPARQVTDAEIAAMDWEALASAVSKCARWRWSAG